MCATEEGLQLCTLHYCYMAESVWFRLQQLFILFATRLQLEKQRKKTEDQWRSGVTRERGRTTQGDTIGGGGDTQIKLFFCGWIMAGFTLSGAAVQKKCGALHLEKAGDLFSHHRPRVSCQFSWKTGDLFLLITLVVHSVVAHNFGISGMQKNHRCFCGGPLFVGAPFRPNMLNMPKSAAGLNLERTLDTMREDGSGEETTARKRSSLSTVRGLKRSSVLFQEK